MKNKIFITLFAALLIFCAFDLSFSNITYADDSFCEIGSSNLNNTTENSCQLGATLKHPEKGWKRYDDTDSKIQYSNLYTYCGYAGCPFNNTFHYSYYSAPCTISFKFYGNKLRILSSLYLDNLNYSSISIDGITHNLSPVLPQTEQCTSNIQYEALNLSNTIHSVTISAQPINHEWFIQFDAIDINQDGELLDYNSDFYLKDKDITIKEKESKPLEAAGNNLVWSSDNQSIAKVDQNGIVTGVKTGTANITVKNSNSQYFKTCKVNVTKTPPINIECSQNTLKVNELLDTYISLNNKPSIKGEDFTIKYDSSKLEFLGFTPLNNSKILKLKDSKDIGELTVTAINKSINSDLNSSQKLINLKFKCISPGQSPLKVNSCSLSNLKNKIEDLSSEDCGSSFISITK